MCSLEAAMLYTTICLAGFNGTDSVMRWNEVLLDAVRTDRTAPPRAARAMAMTQIAVYNAVEAIDGRHRLYGDVELEAPPGTSKEAAIAQAAHDVLVALFPDQSATFDAELDASLARVGPGAAKRDGMLLGHTSAAAILVLRADDGSEASITYSAGSEPGNWLPTPPAFQPQPALPQWPSVQPFCMLGGAQFRRNGPPPLDSSEWSADYNETKALGARNSQVRTADQTQIALFWADGPGTATPPGHWFQIARDVALQQGNTLEENARLFALLGLVEADAAICSWDNKYGYNDWRPVTAIRAGDTDGRADTEPDPAWEPLIVTPPFPSYTSGHSTFSGAGSKALAIFYGTDEIAFSTTSDDYPGTVRHFSSFSEAADEAGRSRIYAGIHWEYDNQDGLASGRELAIYVADNFLKPIDPALLEIPADDVLRCGPVGIIPLAVMAAFACPRRRCGSRRTQT